MKTIWHNYKKDKPALEGYYATIERFGDIDTCKWDNDNKIFTSTIIDECVRYWAYLEDAIPKHCRNNLGYMWSYRGRKPKEE